MKKIFLILVCSFLTLISCNQKTQIEDKTNSEIVETDSTNTAKDGTNIQNEIPKKEVVEKLYSCSMHPEVKGKLNDKCSKCGMKLTEPVAENATK